ncbi:MAG: hypothetical protein ACLP8Y_05340 [Thermoplasmata archaeon]
MNRRVLISIANLVAIAIAFVILIEYQQYSNDAFYVLIAWMVTGFVLLYVIRPRAAPLAGGGPGGPLTNGSPFPSSSSPASPPLSGSEPAGGGLGFCIYCAAPIAPGSRACPVCGHALPRW